MLMNNYAAYYIEAIIKTLDKEVKCDLTLISFINVNLRKLPPYSRDFPISNQDYYICLSKIRLGERLIVRRIV